MRNELDSLLQAYLDGALSPARRAVLERRLAEPKLARRLEQLRRLDGLLKAAAPQPRPEQSRRMWSAIQAQVRAQSPAPLRQPWTAFFTRRWFSLPLGFGLAGAAAIALILVLNGPDARKLSAPEALAPAPAAASAAAPAAEAAPAAAASLPPDQASPPLRRSRAAASLAEAQSADKAMAPAQSSAPAAAPAPAVVADAEQSPTEVERALAENPVDDMIDRFLAARPSAIRPELASAGAPAMASSAPITPYPGMPADQPYDSAAPMPVQGAPDANGFWDWRPAALALNQHQWDQAQAELKAAQAKASEAAERSFAASALSLLSAAGQPLQGSVPALPPTGDLRVLESGRWQLQVDNRVARFGQGVVVRIPGYRIEADSMLLDMTFDRGSFAPGTHFTRVGGETPAHVLNAANQPVEAVDFLAPAGAVYNVQDRELRLR